MAKRTCIFCGAVEVSDEHVFSKWLKDVMPDVASQTKSSHTGTLSSFQSGISAVSRREMPLTVLETRVKRVCGPCNNGWMGSLDGQVKPFLQPMILGVEELSLDAGALDLIARWLYMKTLVYEFVQRPTQVATAEEWKDFYTARTPPANVAIWIGCQNSAGTSWESRMTALSVAVPDPADNPFVVRYSLDTLPLNTLTATLGLGAFFAQILYARHPDWIGMSERVEDADDLLGIFDVQQIWPTVPKQLSWKPSSSQLVGEETISRVGGLIYERLTGHQGPI
jgi:hypothetical protein